MANDAGLPSASTAATRLFTALSDSGCQQIIRATVGEPLTADELAARCDLSRSAVYRKAGTLVEEGILERSTRIRTDEQNVTQYRTAIESLLVEISEENGIELRFDPPSTDENGNVSGDSDS